MSNPKCADCKFNLLLFIVAGTVQGEELQDKSSHSFSTCMIFAAMKNWNTCSQTSHTAPHGSSLKWLF